MKTYHVKLQSAVTSHVIAELTVDAEDEDEARRKALQSATTAGTSLAWSQPFGEQAAYGQPEVISVEPIIDLDDL